MRAISFQTYFLLLFLVGVGCSAKSSSIPDVYETTASNATTFLTPSPELDAAIADMRASHSELVGLKLVQIDADWAAGAPDENGDGGYRFPDGETVAFPEDGRRHPAANTYACGQSGLSSSWLNSTTPPNCTDTGLFRRVYSVPAKNGAQVTVALPTPASMPTGPNQPDQITGFAYVEGWAGENAVDGEGGFQYSAYHQNYTPYVKTQSLAIEQFLPNNTSPYVVAGNASMIIELQAVTSGSATEPTPAPSHTPVSCSSGCLQFTYSITGGTCPGGDVCASQARVVTSGWMSNCCTFGRMTTIARTTGDDFRSATSKAEVFGAVQWSSPLTFTCANGTCSSDGDFATGGYQSYPNSSTWVSVSNLNMSTSAETDTITLQPLNGAVQ